MNNWFNCVGRTAGWRPKYQKISGSRWAAPSKKGRNCWTTTRSGGRQLLREDLQHPQGHQVKGDRTRRIPQKNNSKKIALFNCFLGEQGGGRGDPRGGGNSSIVAIVPYIKMLKLSLTFLKRFSGFFQWRSILKVSAVASRSAGVALQLFRRGSWRQLPLLIHDFLFFYLLGPRAVN